MKNYLNNDLNNSSSDKNSNDYMFVSNNINILPSPSSGIVTSKKAITSKDEAVDTSDLIDDATFDFENLKKNYLNNMILKLQGISNYHSKKKE